MSTDPDLTIVSRKNISSPPLSRKW
jgi:hypothetical protein